MNSSMMVLLAFVIVIVSLTIIAVIISQLILMQLVIKNKNEWDMIDFADEEEILEEILEEKILNCRIEDLFSEEEEAKI